MNHTLYAPWRDEYIKDKKIKGCVFCTIANNSTLDQDHHVLYRSEDFFIVMNKYPYTPGHFMIIPNIHTNALETLDADIWLKMAAMTQQGVKMLKEVLGAHGVNIGMNLGEVAGAGIAEHIHMHLVPRFPRDTNFITTIGQVRVHSTDFESMYATLLAVADQYFSNEKG